MTFAESNAAQYEQGTQPELEDGPEVQMEPSESPEERAAFWARIATKALEKAKQAREELAHLSECESEYQSRALKAEAALVQTTRKLETLALQLQELRAVAREVRGGKTQLERELQASVLIAMLTGDEQKRGTA